MFVFSLSVGHINVDKSVPKMEEVEKQMSREFGGWVSKGGSWRPTECRARVKVRCHVNTGDVCLANIFSNLYLTRPSCPSHPDHYIRNTFGRNTNDPKDRDHNNIR